MATRMLRRGLPRVPGGEPWPPADAAAEVAEAPVREREPVVERAAVVEGAAGESKRRDETPHPGGAPLPRGAASRTAAALRRGLPRTSGGEPWPPAGAAAADVGSAAKAESAEVSAPVAEPAEVPASPVIARVEASSTVERPVASLPRSTTDEGAASLRRGLPRSPGGEQWPPAGTASAPRQAAQATAAAAEAEPPAPAKQPSATAAATTAAATATVETSPPAPSTLAPASDLSTPLPSKPTVWHGTAPRRVAEPAASARPLPTWTQAIAGLFGAAALGVLTGAAVAFVRALLSLPFMQDFLVAFPGEYEPAIHVEPGFAPWIGWQHFFNVFLMVLIIRSGLRIRTEKRPTAFWAPRNNAKGKVSLTIWFHQALDLLWLINGSVFIVLLFTTGHWVRIVPTSWEVLPNALSAALQYVSFDWPTENGWSNYNSLQQLAYFATVFLAAPLAAITGFRMSGLWPKNAVRLSKAYPLEWARAVHFPVMLYFVAFIAVHVALVLLTGFLRNLNHMYASSDAVSWTGFWVFVASLVVIAAGWAAARPLVIAPIAKVFGNVSGR